MHRDNWLVGPHAIRPCGPQDRCFYCSALIGEHHQADCVIRVRTVVVRFTVDLVLPAPESFDADTVSFRYTEGSWCGDNFEGLIRDRVARGDVTGYCLCHHLEGTYLREATAEDETQDGLKVADLPS